MAHLRILKHLVLAALVLSIADSIYSFFLWDLSDETERDLLSLNGMFGFLFAPDWYFYAYHSFRAIALAALLLRPSIGLWLFVGHITHMLVSALIFGASIAFPAGVFMGTILAYLYGGILTVLFLLRPEAYK